MATLASAAAIWAARRGPGRAPGRDRVGRGLYTLGRRKDDGLAREGVGGDLADHLEDLWVVAGAPSVEWLKARRRRRTRATASFRTARRMPTVTACR